MGMSEAAKRAVPKSMRGVPSKSGTGSYPLDTPKHRAEAVALAAMHHGSDSAFTERIRAKASRLSSGAAKKIRQNASKMSVFLLFALLALPVLASPDTFQVTIGAAATQISSTNLYCSSWTIQNNAAHSIRFGDSTVTSSKGILLASGTPGGSFTSPASRNGEQPAPDNLSQWYIAGTQNDVIDVTCDQVAF